VAEQTESSIVIQASPQEVMAVIADLPAYPQWSEGITRVTVLTVADDRPATARFELSSGPIRDVYELAYTWERDDAVHWHLVNGEMLRAMDGSYLLRDTDGATEVRYRLAVDVKVPMIGMIKRKAEKVIIDTALKGLKARVESTSTSS
jgi:ribosome-associated toxin RatA of RatAB toxin-antitoxin module